MLGMWSVFTLLGGFTHTQTQTNTYTQTHMHTHTQHNSFFPLPPSPFLPPPSSLSLLHLNPSSLSLPPFSLPPLSLPSPPSPPPFSPLSPSLPSLSLPSPPPSPSSYVQLVYKTIMGRTDNLPFLTRDAALLRFMHSFLITAPEVVIQLYAITLAINPPTDPTTPSTIPGSWTPIIAALGASLVSLIYTVLVVTTSDRLSGKKRRVILPAHITQILWYSCLLTSRIVALALFARAYGAYVFVIVGAHLVIMLIGVLRQQTTFCNDFVHKKGRWYLEVPFAFVAAFLFIFVYFNAKEGKTRYWVTVYHILTFAENVIMISLFFAAQSQLSYAPAALTVVVGLYPVGLLCMMTYYLMFHPSKTAEWHWIGIPRKCDCSCLRRKPESEPELDTVCEQRQNVVISSPRLVSMNGGVPNLPGILNRPLSTVEPIIAGMEPEHRQNGLEKPMAIVVSPTSTGTQVDGESVRMQYDTHINLPDESIPYHVESHSMSTGIHSQSTDIVTGVKGQTDTEEEIHHNDQLLESPPTSNSNHLSPERRREGVESSPFRHIPAKQTDYLSQKGQLEQHYFPEPHSMPRNWSQPPQSTGRAPWQRYGSAPGYVSNPPPPRCLQDRASASHLPHTSPYHHSSLHRNPRQGALNQPPMRTQFSRPELSPERSRRREELLQSHFSPERLGTTHLRHMGYPSSRVGARRPERWSAWMIEGERGVRDVNLHEPSLDRSRDSLLAQRRSLERGREELRQLYGVNLDQHTSGKDASLERRKRFYWSESVPTAIPPESPQTETKFSSVSPEKRGVLPNRLSTPHVPRFEDSTEQRQRAYSEGEAMLTAQIQQPKLRPHSYLLDTGGASNLPTVGPQRGANIANRSPERGRYFKFPLPVQRPRFPSHVALHNPRTWARPNGGIGPRHSVHTNPLQADPLPWRMYGPSRQMGHGTRTMGGRAHTLLHIPSANSRTTQV